MIFSFADGFHIRVDDICTLIRNGYNGRGTLPDTKPARDIDIGHSNGMINALKAEL